MLAPPRYTLPLAMCVVDVSNNDKIITQGEHLSGKSGNVGEFDSCQGIVPEKSCYGLSPVIKKIYYHQYF